ncbi:MAG TPA: YoaK family protein [Blastocatellia bacterium]|nr:YoaK family protein [Blastocatellia bacterium]
MDRSKDEYPLVAASSHKTDLSVTRLQAVLLTLSLVTGIVDAVSVLGLAVFTANMTGNVVFLGFAVAGAPGFSIARSATSLGAFLLGALIGGRLGFAKASVRRGWLTTVAVCEAALLFVAALASIGFDVWSAKPAYSLYAVIVFMAIAMGLRNATVRRLAVPDLTTTVLTLTLTGIAADSSLAGGNNPRLWRRVGSVVAMFVGAVVGTLLLRYGMALPLMLSGICVLVATYIYVSPLPASRKVEE